MFEILAPSSLRPVDMLLRSMFVTPATLVSAPPRGGLRTRMLSRSPAGRGGGAGAA